MKHTRYTFAPFLKNGQKMRKLILTGLVLLTCMEAFAETIKGKVIDAVTGEEIVGVTVSVKNSPQLYSVTGLDGSFNLDTDAENAILVFDSIGYKTKEVSANGGEELVVSLDADIEFLNSAVVTGESHGRTEIAARNIEKNSVNVINVMSANAIQLSPDITVANVIKRMSGVTVERNSSGEGQYAILRGMDKRYNYTLVNGIKIPSPDNKNRFVPLDIFPSEMLDRIEVSKSLTAEMEGDGIGGAVNLVMKDAPEKMEISANISTGYNALFFSRDFQSFNHRAIQMLSPNERRAGRN